MKKTITMCKSEYDSIMSELKNLREEVKNVKDLDYIKVTSVTKNDWLAPKLEFYYQSKKETIESIRLQIKNNTEKLESIINQNEKEIKKLKIRASSWKNLSLLKRIFKKDLANV